jgi:3-hydroxyanthranilate 3,4-dioxygenase
VNNYLVTNEHMTVMVSFPPSLPPSAHSSQFTSLTKPSRAKIVGGPNARTDYHINTTPEWFYMYRGAMLLKTVTPSGAFHDISINEGEIFLLPPNVPHNPVRFADTVGIVIEQIRPADSVDRLRWYCQNCEAQVHEAQFHATDLGSQIKDAIGEFEKDESARKCKNCGTICDIRPKAKA